MLTADHASPSFAIDDAEPTDRSMLVLQYLTAIAAGFAAILLAVLR